MNLDDGLSESIRHKIKVASKEANSLSQKFGFQSNISVICKNDSQGNKKIQYTELCIKNVTNDPLPILRAIWIEELIAKIQLLILAMKDYPTDSFTTLQSIFEHLQRKMKHYPALAVIMIELETAIKTLEKNFEHQEKKALDFGSQAIH